MEEELTFTAPPRTTLRLYTMGVGYQLINIDKQETITFALLDTGTKASELSGTVISSTLVTYYLLHNVGDRITFVDDHSSCFTLFGQVFTWEQIQAYQDVTERIVQALIQQEIVRDDGIRWIDREEGLFYRNLTNVFDPKYR